MLNPEEIVAANRAKVAAVFERFLPVDDTQTLEKSKDTTEKSKERIYTVEDLEKFKTDLFKSIDEGTVTDDQLTKAQEDLLSLVKETRVIGGQETVVFVKH